MHTKGKKRNAPLDPESEIFRLGLDFVLSRRRYKTDNFSNLELRFCKLFSASFHPSLVLFVVT